MNETLPPFEDLALFAHVARAGSLSAAARHLDMPLPTLSRRMKALEIRLACALFLRGIQGYSLTRAGHALAAELDGLTETGHRLSRWQAQRSGPQPVRITAGTWTARHIARHLPMQNTSETALWRPVFLPSNARLDLARREADIGVRNAPPDHPWLARRRLAKVEFALFGTAKASGHIAGPRGTPSQDWLYATYGETITITARDPRLCLDLAQAGQGQIVLPLFAAEGTGLIQRSDPIDSLSHEAWLVMHQDGRHDPPVRAAIETLLGIFEAT